MSNLHFTPPIRLLLAARICIKMADAKSSLARDGTMQVTAKVWHFFMLDLLHTLMIKMLFFVFLDAIISRPNCEPTTDLYLIFLPFHVENLLTVLPWEGSSIV